MNSKKPTGVTPKNPNPEQTVFGLEDLREWHHDGVSLAVLGHPIAHSISPPMHNAALARMAERVPRFRDWAYFKFDIAPETLPETLSLLHGAGFRGVNLTIPHKIEVLPLLSRIDPVARNMGAVNTLLWTPDGYEGYNSDGYGLSTAVREELGVGLADGPVILLGAGGAARAAAVQCLEENCPELWLGNRNPERLRELAAHLRELAPDAARLKTFPLNDPPRRTAERGLIINATSVGLRPDDPPPLDLDLLPESYAVYDMIYNPPETTLLKMARARGMQAANGLSMLVHQGVRSLEIWSGVEVPADAMRRAAERAAP